MKAIHRIEKFFSLLGYISNVVGTIVLLLIIGHFLIGIYVKLFVQNIPDNKDHVQSVSGDERETLPVYDDYSDNGEFWKEHKKTWSTHFEPYYHWRRGGFQGKYTNVSDDGVRRSVTLGNHEDAKKIFMFGGSTLWGTGSKDEHTIQQRTLDLDLSVRQNLHYHAALHGISRGAAAERIETELTRLELIDRADEKVRQLSGGQVRRVEIARTLIHKPRLLLLDEPTVGLDIGSRQGIMDHARDLIREEGIALLWATHLIDEVGPEDKVIVLHQGSILAQGNVDDVVREAGADSIRDAFIKLTGAGRK